jgi:hypothetical protein
MKNYLIALFFSMGLLSMQTASASTITLENLSAGAVTTGSGETVTGTGNGEGLFGILPFSVSSWKLSVDSAIKLDFNLSGGLPFSTSLFDTPSFTPPPVFNFVGSFGTAMLSSGTYYLSIFSGMGKAGVPYDLSIAPSAVSAVPVPAAIWLFGSVLAGLIGSSRSKSQPKLAA